MTPDRCSRRAQRRSSWTGMIAHEAAGDRGSRPLGGSHPIRRPGISVVISPSAVIWAPPTARIALRMTEAGC
jgi:hypothetical protein